MDAPPVAPPVVAVMVTCDPDEWFEEALAALGAQDYPNLSVLVMDAGSHADPTARVASVLPGAYVRRLAHNEGFAAVANHVFTTVRDAAYFVFCHDDVAPDPEAVRLLVEEALRSNAGIVGPKLVDWNDPERLLEVGLSADKTGYVASVAERHELDQEQHDAVRDVFAVPGAMTLVRSDLFTTLGGFDPEIPSAGEDIDLCWRAQVAGARVLVAPAARVRHLEDGIERRLPTGEDLTRLDARHRLRSVLKNYSAFHLLRVLPQAAVITLAEMVVSLVGGRLGRARAVASAWPWNLRRLPALRRLRRDVRRSRLVPDSEVRRLQVGGSAHLTAYVRGQLAASDGAAHPVAMAGRNLRDSLQTRAGVLGLSVIAVAAFVLVVGSRDLITGRLSAVGQLAPFPNHATTFLREYLSGWRASGLGSDTAAPAAFGLLGIGGFVVFGSMALLRTVCVLGAWPLAAVGVWRLTRPLESSRARIVAVIVTLSVPVPYNALARGRWSGLVAYAAAPWLLSRLMAATGSMPFERRRSERVSSSSLARLAIGLGLVLALAAAFAPAMVVVVGVVALALGLGALVTGDAAAAARPVGLAVVGSAVAAALLFPWTLSFLHPEWSPLGGVASAAARAPTLGALLRFETGPLGAAPLGWAFLVAAAVPLVIGTSWRLLWATRLWLVALACVGVAWAGGRGWPGVGVRSPELFLAPAAIALAVSAALGVVAFELDLPGFRFGFRQLATVVGAAAVVAGTLPVLAGAADGRWELPKSDLDRSFAWMRSEGVAGGFRVLWLGDADALPLDGWRLGSGGTDRDGVAFALSRNGPPTAMDLWPTATTRGVRLVADSVRVAERGDTTRLGHLLSPMAIRFVVVPQRAAPDAHRAPFLAAPPLLTGTLDAQIDLRQLPSDPGLVVYESTAWGPARSEIDGSAGTIPQRALSRGADLAGARPVLRERSPTRFTGRLRGDTNLVLSESSSSQWHLDVAGSAAPRSPAFGWSNTFAVASGGSATLHYKTSPLRSLALLVQLAVWLVVIRALLKMRRAGRRAHLVRVPA